MDVLIIGGTRFVGYQLAWRLVARGDRVTLLNRGTRPDPFGDRVRRIVVDRTTPDFARALAGQRFDAVVDFAAYNAADVQGVIDALGVRGVGHYIMISTGQVYLVREGCPKPSREDDYDGPVMTEPPDPRDRDDWLYGIHKRAAEDVLAAAWRSGGFPSTRLRIPMVNGERDHYRRVESYFYRLLDGGPVIIPDGGKHETRHVYSGAVVRAIMTMRGDQSTFGKAYNLAQEETPTLAKLVVRMAELLGSRSRLVDVPSSAIEAAGLVPAEISPFSGRWMSFLDPSLAQLELGFRHDSLDDYLGKIIAVFLNAPPASPPENYARRADEIVLVDG